MLSLQVTIMTTKPPSQMPVNGTGLYSFPTDTWVSVIVDVLSSPEGQLMHMCSRTAGSWPLHMHGGRP